MGRRRGECFFFLFFWYFVLLFVGLVFVNLAVAAKLGLAAFKLRCGASSRVVRLREVVLRLQGGYEDRAGGGRGIGRVDCAEEYGGRYRAG